MKATLTLLALLALLATPLVAAETLREKLAARAAESNKSGDPAVQAAYARGIEAVAASGILDRVKKVGDKAPEFALKNAAGAEIKLSGLLKDGPVVLTWYRGGWCPYCNIALAAFQEKLPGIKAAGARLVALTPELPDKSLSTKEKNSLTFEVLTDLNHAVAANTGSSSNSLPKYETSTRSIST